MRRLPIFLVLDLSESMVGTDHRQLQAGLKDLASTLKTDPQALETVFISVIGFAGQVQTLVPLVELASFVVPRLPVGSGTHLGQAMTHLMDEIDRGVQPGSPTQKGDWKPIVYLMTDGKPTDSIEAAVSRWQARYASRVELIAIGIGRFANEAALRRFTPNVYTFNNSDEADYKRFIRWISQSVSVQSRSVGMGDSGPPPLASFDETFLKKMEAAASQIVQDEDFAIIRGLCAKTKLPYLMKYERGGVAEVGGVSLTKVMPYVLSGVFPMEQDYLAWSDTEGIDASISTASLVGAPGCPHCGNPIGFAMCRCGTILCIAGPGPATCPSCNLQLDFGESDGSDFDVARGRG